MKPTFTNWRDRVTYVVAEAQLLVAASIVAVGFALWWFDPSIPRLPTWVTDYLVATMMLGPPLFLVFVKFVRWIRVRNWVEVHHVNAAEDVLEKHLVPPQTWKDKTVEGADPWPVNDGSAWAVRQYDYHEETGDLVVEGVWLSAAEDTKLLTSKNHQRKLYSTLLDHYRELLTVRDLAEWMGSRIQHKLINAAAEARERGKHLDPTAVSEAIEDAKDEVPDANPDDLPSIEEMDDLPEDLSREGVTPDVGGSESGAPSASGGESVAADGGGEP